MSLLALILALLLLAAVVAIVGGPLRRAARETAAGVVGQSEGASALAREALEAEREAKYREIRDAELDYRTGKLSRGDFEAIDGRLRAEAIAILDRLEELDEPPA
jgi:hypothetical protein